MKTSQIFSKLCTAIFISFCALNYTSAMADSIFPQPNNNNAIGDKALLANTNCNGGDDCLASGYGNSLRQLLFQPAYNQANAMSAGSILSSILIPPAQNTLAADSKTSKDLMLLVYNKGNVAEDFLEKTPAIFAPNLVIIPGENSGTSSGIVNLLFSRQPPNPASQQKALNTLSFDSIIAPINYVSSQPSSNSQTVVDQDASARAFIKYATGLTNPFRPADFTTAKLPAGTLNLNQYIIENLQKKPEVQAYLLALRTHIAQLSVGISNLNYLYNERKPISDPNLLEQAQTLMAQSSNSSMTPPPSGPVSPLQMQQYMATKRINDPNWYLTMQNAVPATLLRETLFQLAEIPPMLFQLHLDLERLIATMSIMQIQQGGTNRLLLEGMRDKVEKILQNPEEAQKESDQAKSAVDQAEQEQAAQALKGQQSNQ